MGEVLGGDKRTVRIHHTGDAAHPDIIVMATSPGLTSGRVVIPVSVDASVHSVLAVAAASTELELAFD